MYSVAGTQVAAFGGCTSYSLPCGAAYLYTNYDSANANAAFGAGLSF